MLKKTDIKERGFLFIILLFTFYVYLASLFPAYKSNDSPEIAAAGYTLGICHPPGYPFFINISKIFSLIPIGNIAFRINLLSCIIAILTLLITYQILKEISFYLFKTENKIYSAVSVFILAFSYIFWNQSIEAKGGIYQLNLLFLSLIIFFFVKLVTKFNIKYLYLLTYVYSLSLTNHWQSMILLFPGILFVLYYFRKNLKINDLYFIISFFIIGLSVYVFLMVRPLTSPVINWGNTLSLNGFFEFITRKSYQGEITQFSTTVLMQHIRTFAGFFLQNYWFLWIFIIPGFYALFKKQKIMFWPFIYVLFVNFFAVVIYNRTKLEVIWLIKIFLIPFEYVILIFISIGIFFVFNKYDKYKLLFLTVFLVIVFWGAKKNVDFNCRSRDFLSYDMSFNLFNTINNDSYYFTEHDMYFFPVLYESVVNKKRRDVKLIPLPFLQFEWGQKQIQEKYNFHNLSNVNVLNNYYEIINQSLKTSDVVYREFSSDLFDKFLKMDYLTNFSGLLKTISKIKLSESPLIFKLYSLRGFCSGFAKTEENSELVMRYMIFSALQAEKLMNDKRYNEAAELFLFALRIPVEKLEYSIYYNLSLCYGNLNNDEREIYYLNKCISSKPDYVFAHERLGIYYSEKGLKDEARIFLENAIKYGSTNKKVIDLYNNL
jgi:tetratricopeptide (TPR) repeat protein